MIAWLQLVAALSQPADTSRLTLAAVIERALEAYPTVTAVRAARDRAGAELGEARSALLPRLSLDGSLTRFEEPMVVLPLHGFDPRNPPLFDRTLIQSGLSLSWTLFDFGGRLQRVRAQRALSEAAGAAVASSEMQLVARAVAAYTRVLTARELLAAQDQRLQALALAADQARQRLEAGKAARIEVLRVEAERQRALADRVATASRLQVAERELAQLADLPPETVSGRPLAGLRLTETSRAQAPLRDELVARARAESPEIRQLERRRQAAQAAAAAQRAAWFPELRVAGAYVDRGRWAGDFSAEWQVGVALAYPLFTGGARSSAVQRAAADERQAAAQLEAARLALEQAVDQALAALREAEAREAALESALAQFAELVRIERLSLDLGSGTERDYLAALADQLAAQAGLIEARYAAIGARVELARLTGDLSLEWVRRNVEALP